MITLFRFVMNVKLSFAMGKTVSSLNTTSICEWIQKKWEERKRKSNQMQGNQREWQKERKIRSD